jgi:hypothetical protein
MDVPEGVEGREREDSSAHTSEHTNDGVPFGSANREAHRTSPSNQ